MAKVTAQVIGGSPKILENVDTVGECRDKLGLGSNYRAMVNDEPAHDGDSTELDDFNFVYFVQNEKGA